MIKKIFILLISVIIYTGINAQGNITADDGSGPVTDSISVCQGTLIDFTTDSIGTYAWEITDGINIIHTANTQTITYTFANEGGYFVSLDFGGSLTIFWVKVSLTPIFNGTTVIEDTVCPGQIVNLNGVIWSNQFNGSAFTSNLWVVPVPSQVYAGIYLPDGSGASYSTSITQTQFVTGQTITTATDVASICVNIEHSYLGDLEIKMTCPNNQSVILKPYPGGGSTYLGEAVDNNTFTQGVCWNYCFTMPPATYSTMLLEFGSHPYSYVNALGVAVNNHDVLPAGTYLPENSYNGFIGCPLNGNWTITITDNLFIDDGYLCDWSINFAPYLLPATYFIENTYNIFNWTGPGTTGGTMIDQGLPVVSNANESYTFSVTDDFGCTYDTIVDVFVRDAGSSQCCTMPFPTAGVDDSTCSGSQALSAILFDSSNLGTWSVASGPGFANFSNPSDPNATVNFSADGSYKLVWTEVASSFCTNSDTVTIYYHPSPTVAFTTTPSTCYGNCNATITANPTGSGAPYTYQWNDPNFQTTATASGLCSGAFTVNLTNKHGCTSSQTQAAPAPPVLQISMSVINVLCVNNSDGSVIAMVTGGTPPYSFIWDDPNSQTTSVATGLDGGTYSVTATDASGCIVVGSAVVDEPEDPLLIQIQDSNDVSCNGLSDANIVLYVSGGTYPYLYNWDNGVTIFNNNDIQAGVYTVTVTDYNNCVSTKLILISEPDELTYTSSTTPSSCFEYSDGTATILPTGGTVPYSYLWSNGTATQSITGAAGMYNIDVTDANGCNLSFPIEVTQPDKVVAGLPSDETICINQSITINASATGGVPPYTYLWNNDATNLTSQSTVSPNITTSYIVSAKDVNGCISDNLSITINVNDPLSIDLAASDHYVCKGDPFILTLFPSGGSGNYTFSTDNGTIISSPYNLYTTASVKEQVKITISDDCGTPTAFDTISVNILSLPEFTFQPDITEGCQPLDVSFIAIASNNTFNYTWNFGDELDNDNISTKNNPTHTFNNYGDFAISLIAETDSGCRNTITVQDLINVYKKPTADFLPNNKNVSVINPTIVFTNKSSDGYKYQWLFGDGDSSSVYSPSHKFPSIEDKWYNIDLLVTSKEGCTNTISDQIYIDDEHTFYSPTAFSPDNDRINDTWKISGNSINTSTFSLYIFDRWGEIVYSSTNPNEEWNGTIKDNSEAPTGLYSWIAKFKDIDGLEHTKSGTIMLFK